MIFDAREFFEPTEVLTFSFTALICFREVECCRYLFGLAEMRAGSRKVRRVIIPTWFHPDRSP